MPKKNNRTNSPNVVGPGVLSTELWCDRTPLIFLEWPWTNEDSPRYAEGENPGINKSPGKDPKCCEGIPTSRGSETELNLILSPGKLWKSYN